MPTTTKENAAPPVHRIRLGEIEAAIWERSSDKGTFYSATFSRSYKAADKWQRTGAFNARDLDTLTAVIDQCRSWMADAALKAKAEKAGVR